MDRAWRALGQLVERGHSDLRLASDRLVSELQSYRELAVLLAGHPSLVPLVTGGSGDTQDVERMMLGVADMTGSLEILLLNRDGAVVAQSHSFFKPRAAQPERHCLFQTGNAGGVGVEPIGSLATSGSGRLPLRRLYLAWTASRWRSRRVRGFGADRVQLAGGGPQVVFFTDEAGVVFISNRAEMLYRSRVPLEQLALGRPFRAIMTQANYGHSTSSTLASGRV